MPPDNASRVPVKSVETTLRILETLQNTPAMTVTEIASELGVAKSTAHSHIQTLERRSYVNRNGDTYRLGHRCLSLGGHVQVSERLYHASKDEVDELAEETGEQSQILVEQSGRGTYLYQSRSDRAIPTDSHIGTRVYLHCTAMGKAILAKLPRERVLEIIDQHGLPARSSNTITTPDALFDELDQIRETGISYDDGERIEGMRCVAAPILTEEGDVEGAISVSGPSKRIKHEVYRETLPELVSRTARTIEIKARYS